MKYKVNKRELLIDDYFKVEKVQVEFDKHNESDRNFARRFNLIRGKAVTALIYHKEKDAILMVKQFRYSTAEAGYPWLLELPAGLNDKNEDHRVAMQRELIEETGYKANDLREIHKFFVAPGCTDEEIILFYAEVDESDKVAKGGGVENEHEDIEIDFLPVSDLEEYIKTGKIHDAKSIIGFYWFLENKRK